MVPDRYGRQAKRLITGQDKIETVVRLITIGALSAIVLGVI